MLSNTKFAFFGSSKFSVICLEELKTLGILPALIITTPDMQTGRGLKLTPTPVKIWAENNKIECLSPDKFDSDFTTKLSTYNSSLFLVASYGKIIPKAILNLPQNGTLNIHPSLLPKYRGPSPLQEQILNNEKEVGVTIILLDEKMDHGPIIKQEKVEIENWPVKFGELEKITAVIGAKLFAKVLPDWLENKITPTEQNHAEATFTKKIKKEDGLIDIENGDSYQNYLKFLAYSTWPGVYFFTKKKHNLTPTLPLTNGRERKDPLPSLDKEGLRAVEKTRVIIKEAEFKNGQFIIKKVLPEGKKEMNYQDFLRGLK